MARITAADLFDEFELDLWGHVYRLREGTKSVSAKIREREKAIDALPDDADEDAVFDALAEMLDVMLEPINDGDRTHAKTVLTRKWKAQEVGLDRVEAITNLLAEEAVMRKVPPSRRPRAA